MKLSIIMPVYNERETISRILEKVRSLDMQKEIIVVDDHSKDGTSEYLHSLAKEDSFKVLFHDQNLGKGAAIRTGLEHVTGDAVVIQDADLEVNPKELPRVVKPIEEGIARVVYGSRFKSGNSFSWITLAANRILTALTNLLYNVHISDMETCYKCIETSLIKSLELKARGFDFEPEVTAKIAKRRIRIHEVPISYRMRSVREGKKIGWRDGLQAVYFLLKYRFTE